LPSYLRQVVKGPDSLQAVISKLKRIGTSVAIEMCNELVAARADYSDELTACRQTDLFFNGLIQNNLVISMLHLPRLA